MKKLTLFFLTFMLFACSAQATDYVFRKKWDQSSAGNEGTTPAHISSMNYGIAYKGSDYLAGFSSYLTTNSNYFYSTIKTIDGTLSTEVPKDATMSNEIGGSIAVDENGYFFICNVVYNHENTCQIRMSVAPESAFSKDIITIPGLSPTIEKPNGAALLGYGIDVKRNSSGVGFALITASENMNYGLSKKNTGVVYFPITETLTNPTFGTPTKLIIPDLGPVVRVRIVDDTHFWIDGGRTVPKLVTISSSSTPTIQSIATFNASLDNPNILLSEDVVDFTFLNNERFVLMGTDKYNEGTSAGCNAKVFQITGTTSSQISASTPIATIGPLSTSISKTSVVSCAAKVVNNSTDRKEVHLYAQVAGQGAMSYIMEEAPEFKIAGTNGFPTFETAMEKVETSTTGTLNFTEVINEVSVDNPTFSIKHKNVLNSDWHDNNKLGASGLTTVTCIGCILSDTIFTPSEELSKEGKSLKITVTYTDDLTKATPTKVYKVKCEELRYFITYESNGGSNVAIQDYTSTTNLTLATAPIKLDYTFVGWKVKATKGNWTVGNIYSSNQNVGAGKYGFVTLEAQWTPNHYTINYNPNGGTGTMTASEHIYGEESALTSNTFEFGDFGFIGWSTTPDGEVEYDDKQSITCITATHNGFITLYAKWATCYRLHSSIGTCNECYSNTLSYNGYFSLYHKEGNNLTMQVKDEHGNWKDLPPTKRNIECSITNKVIKAKFNDATKTISNISEYTDNFYVRSASANGGFDCYTNPEMNNKMELLTGTKNYCWAKHIDTPTKMKTVVGNLYNPQISATICDNETLNDASAIRVNYDPTTNEVKLYQAQGKTVSIGESKAIIGTNMKCTLTLTSLYNGTNITTIANVNGMQAIATKLDNITLIDKRVRIVYDFRTDSVFFACIPSSEMEDINIANSDLLIIASDEETQKLAKEFSVANGRVVYERTFSNNKIWYWISFPYDVKISDMEKVPQYGTAWILQKYNTEARANLTGNRDTYWEYLPETATLNAHEGYLLGFENNYPMPATLKFPSAYCKRITTFNEITNVTLPNYKGTHAGTNFDANWHLIGSPVYTTSKVMGPKYIININANNTGYIYGKTAENTDLDPFTAFFVQYDGDQDFTKQAHMLSVPRAQEKSMVDEEYYELVMANVTYTEKTGIVMANDGNIDVYEPNKDLMMMASWGSAYPQLFTCGASNKKMAINHLAKTTQTTLRIGLYAGKAEAYTFSLKNKEVPAISVILRDKERGTETNLLYNDYTFNAAKGNTTNRFELIINRKTDISTGIMNTSDNTVQFTQTNDELTISGVEPGINIRLFDMAGRCIYQGKTQVKNTLQSIPSGIYTAIIGTETHKIVVK